LLADLEAEAGAACAGIQAAQFSNISSADTDAANFAVNFDRFILFHQDAKALPQLHFLGNVIAARV
jgi:hypothetical protein